MNNAPRETGSLLETWKRWYRIAAVLFLNSVVLLFVLLFALRFLVPVREPGPIYSPDFEKHGMPQQVCEPICNMNAGLVLVTTMGGHGLMNLAARGLRLFTVNVVIVLEPAIAIGLGVLLLGETVTARQVAGGAILAASVVIALLPDWRSERRAPRPRRSSRSETPSPASGP